jgi:LPXTG-site transpeptidase (sortase) family protein
MTIPRRTLRSAQLFFALLLGAGLLLVAVSFIPHGLEPLSIASGHDLPVRLRIPMLHIDAPVLPVGLTHTGEMDVPSGADEVGWFAPGIFPGETGNAVLAGHRDTFIRSRAIFADLKKLTKNDDVYVDTASGQTLHFRVRTSSTYPYDKAPLQEIFGASSGRSLNLITCSGIWDRWTYTDRLVVFTTLVSPEDGNPKK